MPQLWLRSNVFKYSKKSDAELCSNGLDSFFVYDSKPLAADAQAHPAVFLWYEELFIVQVRQQPNLFFAIGMGHAVPH